MRKILSILGAGGHGRVIAECAESSKAWDTVNFYDDNVKAGQDEIDGFRIVGPLSDLPTQPPDSNHQLVIGIGKNELRLSLQHSLAALGWTFATVYHPNSTVSRFASVGPGTVLMAGAIVNTGAIVGAACILNTNSCVDHDCELGSGVHLSPGATLAGGVRIGQCTWIGAGSVVIEKTHIGASAIIGAGSVVIDSIESDTVSVGAPARMLRRSK